MNCTNYIVISYKSIVYTICTYPGSTIIDSNVSINKVNPKLGMITNQLLSTQCTPFFRTMFYVKIIYTLTGLFTRHIYFECVMILEKMFSHTIKVVRGS